MADLSKIKLNGTTYNLKDAEARATIENDVMVKDVDYVTAGKASDITMGEKATAEGKNTKPTGQYSHAEGSYAEASGSNSHAEGSVTEASGAMAHAEGTHTTASGNSSHAEGTSTTASGYTAHAEGDNTHANHRSQHVFGAYNILDNSTAPANSKGNYVEIVGNGTIDARSNARTLDWNGNEVLAGKLTVGTNPTGNMDVATKQYVDTAVSEITVPVTSVNGQTGDVSLTIPTVPTTVSTFTNDANYQTSTQVQSAINTAIGNINSFEVAVVSSLPASDINDHAIYFVPQAVNSSTHDEYMYINNNWELIGNTTVDLSGYLQKTEIAAWAKASTKPSYTASEVGALPDTTVIPAAQVQSDWNATTGMGVILNKPTIPTVPTNVSDFTNDVGYLTSYTETDPTVPAWAKAASKPTYTAAEVGAIASTAPAAAITSTDISNWNAKSDFSGSYNDLTNKPTIPAATTVTQTLTTGTAIGSVNSTTLYAPTPYDDTALAARVTALENIPWVTYYTGSSEPNSAQGNNGDIYLQAGSEE